MLEIKISCSYPAMLSLELEAVFCEVVDKMAPRRVEERSKKV